MGMAVRYGWINPITRGDRYRTQRARPLSSAMVVPAGDQRARSASARR